jgi:hypothetical protein
MDPQPEEVEEAIPLLQAGDVVIDVGEDEDGGPAVGIGTEGPLVTLEEIDAFFEQQVDLQVCLGCGRVGCEWFGRHP